MVRAKAKGVSRAAVNRALRDGAELWKPPDKNDNGHGQVAEVGTDELTELHAHSTPARAPRKVAP